MGLFFVGLLAGIFLGGITAYVHSKKRVIEFRNSSDKHLEMFLLMDCWLQNKHKGKRIGDYLKERNIQNVIVYGVSYMGKRLYEELKNDNIEVKYFIDQNAHAEIDGKKVKQFNDESETVDAIIVTAVYYFDELENKLNFKFNCPILSLADIVYKM